jgi:hypothetical protein
MVEPNDMVLEILKDLRAETREGFRRVEARLTSLEDRVDTLEIRLDGLSHAMMSGFGSIVRELKDINGRLAALEAERA